MDFLNNSTKLAILIIITNQVITTPSYATMPQTVTKEPSSNIVSRNQEQPFATNTWFEKIKISGLFLGEYIMSNQNPGSTRFGDRRDYSILCFPRANLYIEGDINEWTQSYMAFNFRNSCCYGSHNDEAAARKFDKVDEVFVKISNPQKSPVYSKFGIQYVPYGNYQRNTIPSPFTQLLTQTQDGAVVVGYIGSNNFNYNAYLFNGKKKRNSVDKTNNGGASISYQDNSYEINLDYMKNIASGVNAIVQRTNNPLNSGYRKIVPGVSVSFKGQWQPFDTTIQYTSALTKFAADDIAWQGGGAKLAATLIEVGYTLPASWSERTIRAAISYNQSFEAVNMKGGSSNGYGLPKRRAQGDLRLNILDNVTLGFHIIYDKDYAVSEGGTDRDSLTGLATLKVRI